MKIKPWIVVAYLVETNLKRQALADKAGISTGTLTRALRGKPMVHETVYRLSKAMGVKPQDLIEEGGRQ